jgi:hypothetical protein
MDDIKHLWIIARDAGVCIFEASLGDLEKDIDGDLIAGFFTAILQFAKEISDTDVKSINLSDANLLFSLSEHVVLVRWVSDASIFNKGERILRELEQEFTRKYQNVFEPKWDGNVSVFSDFATDVQRITNQTPLERISSKWLGKYLPILPFMQRMSESRANLKDLMTNPGDFIKFFLHKMKTAKKAAAKHFQK